MYSYYLFVPECWPSLNRAERIYWKGKPQIGSTQCCTHQIHIIPILAFVFLWGGTQGRLRAKVVPKYHLADPWLFVSMNCLADRTSHLYPVRVYYFNTDQFFLLKETGSGRCWQKIALNYFRWCWNEAVWGTVIVVKIFKSKFQSAFQTSDKAKKKCFLFTTLNQLH